ncbi:MAG: SusC/RagA family TonB-linked outer membrane protein [Muribaculaceae bacterium]
MRSKIRRFHFLLFMFCTLWAALPVTAQNVTLKGKVVDAKTSEPLIGATVMVKGTSQGSVSDIDGLFLLSNVKKDAVIVVSSIGYNKEEIALNGRSEISVSLKENSEVLDEVVVVGYGTMDKKELTSAISHISDKDFLSVSTIDPAMMIQGKVAGVSITNTGAGDPNNQASIQIRGVSSRSASNDPLIVIDGVPGGNLTNINSNDIASFDILKDGAASAIYGTRGSNGVILITTKKGARDGAVHTSYNGSVSFDVANKELDMLTADEYRELRLASGSGIDLGGNDDWWKAVTRTGFSHKHTLTLSGGNQKTNYRVSADYRNANGIDRRSGREEYGARASINHTTLGGLFTFSLNVAPRIAYRKNSDWNTFRNALEANPTTPIMDPNDPSKYYNFQGQVVGYNPVEANTIEQSEGETKLIDWDATVKLNLLPLLLKNKDANHDLTTQLTFADHQYDNFNGWFRPSTSTQAINNGRDGEASRDYSKERSQSLEWIANYKTNFGKHFLKVMAGYSYQYSKYSGLSASNKDFSNDGLGFNNLGTGEFAKEEGEVNMGSYMNDSKLIAFFGRVSYDYQGKYMFTASLRHEGSSKFGANNKWGNFPAVSAGWRISEESFMSGTKSWLSDLKIRGDFGVTGNQNFGSYNSLSTMTGFGYYTYNGKYFQVWGPAKNVNPDLKWEKGKNWNVGLDFALLNNRIYGSLNYFSRRQQDLLGTYKVSVPPFLHDETFVNVGTMKNTGFEFDITWDAVKTKDFEYSLGIVGSTMDNKFIDFSNSQYVGQDYYNVCGTEDPYPYYNLQRIEKGERIGNFYMWKFAGVDKNGEWLIYDRDGDIIKAAQASDDDRQVVGNGLPKFTGSMTHNFRYKNVDLTLFFRGAFGYDIFNIHDFYYGTQNFTGNVLKKAFEKNAPISASANPVVCDYFLESGDYLKLDMITLGYTLNTNWKYLSKIRVYGTAKNVFTITKYSGVDPATFQLNGLNPGATGSRSYYPSTRQFIFGVQLDF